MAYLAHTTDEEIPVTATAPHTDPDAKVKETQNVVESRVIKCDTVFYREATFGGVFLLAGKSNVTYKDGKTYALVKMLWHGWQPKRGSCRITLLGHFTIEEHYTGNDVVARVG
jgi:hypothetical protein